MLLGAEIILAESKISKDVSQLSKKEVFGLGKKANWSDVLCKYLIIDMFNCSGGDNLDQCDIDCLNGKLSTGLTNNCC